MGISERLFYPLNTNYYRMPAFFLLQIQFVKFQCKKKNPILVIHAPNDIWPVIHGPKLTILTEIHLMPFWGIPQSHLHSGSGEDIKSLL